MEELLEEKFLQEDFLLNNETAVELFRSVKDLPIIDYHCHLNPKEIAEDKTYKNLTEIWLGGDHYKWRAMRSNGVPEEFITGNASDYDKFLKWVETLEECIGNPLYSWTHLELARYFDYHKNLSLETAREVWEHCNAKLKEEGFSAKGILRKFNVKVVCTTDDPIDNLEYHIKIKEDRSFDCLVLPAFRPSNAMNIENPEWKSYISKLSDVTGVKISSYEDIKNALYRRTEFFNLVGCKLSDHALDPIVYVGSTNFEIEDIVVRALKGETLTETETRKYKTRILNDLGKKYKELNWTMQLHIGTIRNVNTRMFKILGPDTGFDVIGDENIAGSLAKTLDTLDKENNLPKTIIYSLNPGDNEVIGSMIGAFQDGSVRGKIQFGSAWWFNDQKDGMERQMIALGNLGILPAFVGMLTDSRSFLSYPRHEYFRRILCNLIGSFVQNGEYPKNMNKLLEIVKNICYYNAERYFNFK